MLRFLSRMAKLPVEVFVSGVEVMARAMRELQGIFNEALDALTDLIGRGFDEQDG